MKAISRYIMNSLFGLYFLLAGTGFNIVNYCCNSCETQGIEYVAQNSCNAVHHHENDDCCNSHSEPHCDMACSNIQHHPDGCHILRLKVEIPSIASAFELTNISSFVHVLFPNEHSLLGLLTKQVDNSLSDLPPPSDIPILTGRDILVAKSVFII